MTKLAHSQQCSTVWLRSVYDRDCPRCSIVGKVIMLRRKTHDNGATFNEALQAKIIAKRLIERNGLVGAELIDRLYTSATNKIVTKHKAARPKFEATQDAAEGMGL